jgi:hypothetical protein
VSKLGATALMVAIGYLLFRILLGSAKLLYLLCKIAVLIPIALFALCAGNVHLNIRRTPDARPANAAVPETGKPVPAPELGPATISSSGDWRQDRETLKQLLQDGKIQTSKGGRL